MKRLAIVFLAAALVAALVPQALDAGVGIKGGYSLAKFAQTSALPVPTWGNTKFFVGGLSFEGGLGFFSLQPEILYVRMGGKYTIDADNSLENRLEYIQAPVLIKLNIMPGPIRPFIYGGGYGAYLVKAKGIMVVAGVPQEAPLTDNFERLDYGVVGGAGLSIGLAGVSVSIEGRYNYGLKNILKDPAAGETMKNRCLMALVGLNF
jgi:hypothetical protein